VDLDCCLTEFEREKLHELPLQKPLTNILSYVEDLNLASVKISEVQELINQEQSKRYENFNVITNTWGSVILTIVTLILTMCFSCCCCKCCRQCVFWFWDKWTPKECLRQTKERCCVVTNINANRVLYHEVQQTPPLSPMSRKRELTPRGRSPSRISENWELTEFPSKSKVRERNAER